MNQKPQVRWYFRWWAMLLATLIVTLLAWYGSTVFYDWQTDKELAKELLVLDEHEPNWRFENLSAKQPVLKDDENLALAALHIKSRITGDPMGYDTLYAAFESWPARRLSEAQCRELKLLLGNCSELPKEIDQLLLLQSGAFSNIDYRDPSYKVIAVQTGRQQELRRVANLLKYYSHHCLEENHSEAALKACEANLQLTQACAHDPFIMSQLVRITIQNTGLAMIERALAQGQYPADTLSRLQARLISDSDVSNFKAGILGDRAGIDRYLREVSEGRYSQSELASFNQSVKEFTSPGPESLSLKGILRNVRSWFNPSPHGYIPEERLKVLRFYGAVLALINSTDGGYRDDLKALFEQHRAESKTIQYFGAFLSRLYEADVRRQLMMRMTAVLLAAERYRLEKGKVPAGWNDLVPQYFPNILIDSYDGKPIRWKVTPTGFILYSVGLNLNDDDGAIRRSFSRSHNPDLGIEFFAPAYRQVAPLDDGSQASIHGSPDQKDLFFAAARSGTTDKLKQILNAGFDVNTKTEYGATALCFAARFGHLEVMKLLIDKKIDLDAKDTFYHSDALTWALSENQHEAVGLLLKAGAKGEAGALSYALAQNKPKVLTAVLASGRIKQEALDSSLNNIDARKTELIKLLTEAGAKGKPKEAKAEEKKTEPATAKTEEAVVPTTPVVELTSIVQTPKPWPGFRGINNAGVADGQFPPTGWDTATGKNLTWKTPIPGLGLSCPVVWGKRLIITTAINQETPKPSLRIGQYGDVDSVKEKSPHTWMTYCLDTDTGKILWEQKACTGVPKVKRHMKSSHANATPAVDGRYVVANFGSEGLYCYSIEGKLLWKKELGKLGSGWFFNPDYEWGFGSSPVIFEETVIVQCDIGKNSFIAAYALEDGKEMWNKPREEIPSWCSPTIVQPLNSRAELVTVASKYARGYDPYTGDELWQLSKFSEIAVPTPFYANGLIYLTTGYRPIQPIFAIKAGARGDITLEKGKETNDSIVWSKTRGGPYLPTPLVYGDHLYVCTNAGVLSCYEAKTGKVIYQKRLGGKNGYTASLVAADGRIYCTDEEGVVRVVQAGPEFKLLAINKLGEECLSHPAISNGRIYFRGREHVMAFAVPPVKQ